MLLCISSVGDIDRIDMLHERLSEAGETVFTLKERAAELVCWDRDFEMANFHSNIYELSTHLYTPSIFREYGTLFE